MKSAQIKLATPNGYQALNPQTVCAYLGAVSSVADRLGGNPGEWRSREVGDGNLNLVFIVEGLKAAIVVKQALPYVRMVGDSWPLPLDRAYYEYRALVEQGRWAPEFVPSVYHHDEPMALSVMEYLSPHVILRKGLVAGHRYPLVASHVGKFLAHTLFHTSDLHLDPVQKRHKIAEYLTNTAMCKISEDLIFDEAYFAAPMNRHTAPQLDDIALKFRQDAELKLAVQELKNKFMNNAEALLHGDLHTGSVMVTQDDTRVIDPEFAFFGPMGFDVGAFMANLFLSYFSKEKGEHADWVLNQVQIVWDVFVLEFTALWNRREGGDLYNPRLYGDAEDLKSAALKARLSAVFEDSLGFASCKMIRRILGLAHVEDFESIQDQDVRSARERKALEIARYLILERKNLQSISHVIKAAK